MVPNEPIMNVLMAASKLYKRIYLIIFKLNVLRKEVHRSIKIYDFIDE
jgi:hypothetical protein